MARTSEDVKNDAEVAETQKLSDPPVLGQRYSGIPKRLLHKAREAKQRVYENQTKPVSSPRRRAPALPPGIAQERFNAAILELSQQLGNEHVVINDQPLDDGWYMEHPNTHDAFPLFEEEETDASAMGYPSSTQEVQQSVLWANKNRIPIYPISMGRNLGYGGAAPRVRGSAVIDLGRRMNKVLDINSQDCTCLLEPGVSFYALYEEIQSKGYKNLWIDVPDLGGGSVIGNTIDRSVRYTPYRDHWANHSGLEVVLPTGEVIRTGMGALPGSNTWQTFPYGLGPISDGIFSQSNFGIVTKMGMALMPDPGGHESFMYTFKEQGDLPQIIELIRPLRISNILENVAQLKSSVQEVAALGKQRSTIYNGKGPVPMSVIRRELKKLPCGDCTWIYYGASYGPKSIRQYKLDIIHKEFSKVPGARRIDPATLPKDHYFWARDNVAAGVPDLQELDWLDWLPNGGHVFFSPISSTRGVDAMKLLKMCMRRHEEFGIDCFPAFCIGLREMHLIVNMVYDRAKPEGRQAAYNCMRAMIDDAAKSEYGEYRIHLLLQDQVAWTYSWNNNALMHFNERLKDTLDPNGILAPGRNGIWPAGYRNRKPGIDAEWRENCGRVGVVLAPDTTRL